MNKNERFLPYTSSLSQFCFRKVEDCKFSILESPFYLEFLKSMEKALEIINVGNVEHCVCYGLGNISSSVISRYQFSLLLLLRDHFKLNVDIYDPVFLPVELEFLSKYDMNQIDYNEEGLRQITSPTIIYMPHCPTALTNNLLWCNWLPDLSNCIIFGNSFGLLSETLTESDLKTKFQCIHSILPVTNELRIDNDFKYSDIFNDLSWHVFPPNALNELPSTFWENIEKPIYDDQLVECITKKMFEMDVKTSKIL